MAQRILVFGYSIAQGYWDIEGGWVQRLRRYLDKKALESKDLLPSWSIFNLGISGETIDHLLDRFDSEVKARTNDKKDINATTFLPIAVKFLIVELMKRPIIMVTPNRLRTTPAWVAAFGLALPPYNCSISFLVHVLIVISSET